MCYETGQKWADHPVTSCVKMGRKTALSWTFARVGAHKRRGLHWLCNGTRVEMLSRLSLEMFSLTNMPHCKNGKGCCITCNKQRCCFVLVSGKGARKDQIGNLEDNRGRKVRGVWGFLLSSVQKAFCNDPPHFQNLQRSEVKGKFLVVDVNPPHLVGRIGSDSRRSKDITTARAFSSLFLGCALIITCLF